QVLWCNWNSICELLRDGIHIRFEGYNPLGDRDKIGVMIETCNGILKAAETDWIVKNDDGWICIYIDEYFKSVYERYEGGVYEEKEEKVKDKEGNTPKAETYGLRYYRMQILDLEVVIVSEGDMSSVLVGKRIHNYNGLPFSV